MERRPICEAAMTRIFVGQPYAVGDLIPLEPAQVHYLRDVLRLREGEAFLAVLPDGREAEARLEGEGARVTRIGPGKPQPPARVLLYAALTKHRRFEWMIEKVTEVGAAEILPMVTEHAVVRPREERLAAQVERWNKLAEAAGRQCHSPTVPPVAKPLEFPAALAHWQAQAIPGIIFTLPTPEEPPALKRVLADLGETPAVALFIGPEGDFSPAEVRQAVAAGLHPASLGPRVLRAETAAVVAAALCLYEIAGSPRDIHGHA
jgi:16S rRNA (uracil1498-N3)-methyltransferase